MIKRILAIVSLTAVVSGCGSSLFEMLEADEQGVDQATTLLESGQYDEAIAEAKKVLPEASQAALEESATSTYLNQSLANAGTLTAEQKQAVEVIRSALRAKGGGDTMDLVTSLIESSLTTDACSDLKELEDWIRVRTPGATVGNFNVSLWTESINARIRVAGMTLVLRFSGSTVEVVNNPSTSILLVEGIDNILLLPQVIIRAINDGSTAELSSYYPVLVWSIRISLAILQQLIDTTTSDKMKEKYQKALDKITSFNSEISAMTLPDGSPDDTQDSDSDGVTDNELTRLDLWLQQVLTDCYSE